jgi:hypothetical protein
MKLVCCYLCLHTDCDVLKFHTSNVSGLSENAVIKFQLHFLVSLIRSLLNSHNFH